MTKDSKTTLTVVIIMTVLTGAGIIGYMAFKNNEDKIKDDAESTILSKIF